MGVTRRAGHEKPEGAYKERGASGANKVQVLLPKIAVSSMTGSG